MRTLIISDTHINHQNIATYCNRPADFSDTIKKNILARVQFDDRVIHLGDVFIGKSQGWDEWRKGLPGHWILVRGNHDHKSCAWYMDHGFDFACDAMAFRGCWLTHKPASLLPGGCNLNIHGHLHNIWHGFLPEGSTVEANEAQGLHLPWQRLFAVEYTNYCPIEFDEFVNHPDKYQARGPRE